MEKLSLQDVSQLSVAEKIQLVEDLWDSIAESPENLAMTQNQQRELDRRLDAHRENADAALPWNEVKTRLQS